MDKAIVGRDEIVSAKETNLVQAIDFCSAFNNICNNDINHKISARKIGAHPMELTAFGTLKEIRSLQPRSQEKKTMEFALGTYS